MKRLVSDSEVLRVVGTTGGILFLLSLSTTSRVSSMRCISRRIQVSEMQRISVLQLKLKFKFKFNPAPAPAVTASANRTISPSYLLQAATGSEPDSEAPSQPSLRLRQCPLVPVLVVTRRRHRLAGLLPLVRSNGLGAESLRHRRRMPSESLAAAAAG